MENNFKYSAVEALILASPDPLGGKKIADMIDDLTPSKVAQAVAALNNNYMEIGSSFRIREISGGYQFYIVNEFAGFVQEMFARRRKLRLTRASLETLAIIAYKQPVTKVEIEQIRGVASDGVIHNLLEKKMLTITGRAATVGKPLQYGTTDEFLKFFGLNKIADLPKMSEIEELITAEEEQNQTEFSFPQDSQELQDIKLNIADGTFKPTDEDELPENLETVNREGETEENKDIPHVEETSNDDNSVVVDVDQT